MPCRKKYRSIFLWIKICVWKLCPKIGDATRWLFFVDGKNNSHSFYDQGFFPQMIEIFVWKKRYDRKWRLAQKSVFAAVKLVKFNLMSLFFAPLTVIVAFPPSKILFLSTLLLVLHFSQNVKIQGSKKKVCIGSVKNL